MKHDEGWTEAADGTRLYWQRHTLDNGPRAALLFVHGLAEHSGRYGHVMRHFADSGIRLLGRRLSGSREESRAASACGSLR